VNVYTVSAHIFSSFVCLEVFTALGVEIPILVTFSEDVCVEKLEMNITDMGCTGVNQLSISCDLLSHFFLDSFIKKK